MSIFFQPIRLNDRDLFLRYQPLGSRICDQTFTSLFCWQEFYGMRWALVEDRLVIRCHIYGERRIGYMVLPDIQTARFPELISELQKDVGGMVPTLINLSEEESRWLSQQQPGQWAFDHNRDFDDYLYETAKFQTYSGKKLAAKRNHVNKFKTLYTYSYQPLTAEWFDACLKLEYSWHIARGEESRQATAEQMVIHRAFDHFEALNIMGGVLLVEDQPVAFTYGSPLNENTFCVHIEKADTTYEGVYPVIAQLFAQHLPSQYQYLDREEDMGLSGLRKSKESYQPIRMEKKINCVMLDQTRREIMEVWERCFGDEASFVQSFLTRYYFEDTAFLHREGGKVVATCFLILCDTDIGRIGYLYAIATLPEYRNQGIAAKLVQKALDRCRTLRLTAAALIPANEHLGQYYNRLGFTMGPVPVQFPSDLDLGTGDSSQDNALLIPLDEGLTIPSSLICFPLM
ncbi:MAG: GNAT family N-acetyltransferase [Bacteroidales bacterium]|nr:GNAT family N-acetyltransferase [Bacteroidales bacterium]